ncbi:hypothetical protein EIMP300_78870 [Escherichia coli]|uniref:Lysine decarboxylase n=1 Tax=Escherichia coli TaxID=562 RepID=A0A8S0G2X9_ECOLX|nr:hypothetical protein EIMP300_78870 [Escherichia coli]
MNIIAIMGPHGVFYKDEPIKELESALVAQGFHADGRLSGHKTALIC